MTYYLYYRHCYEPTIARKREKHRKKQTDYKNVQHNSQQQHFALATCYPPTDLLILPSPDYPAPTILYLLPNTYFPLPTTN